jgi:hypothetical protein
MLVVPDFDHADYVTIITRKGRIKRMELNAFSNVRTSGVIAMNLDSDDSLDWARLTSGDEDFVVITRNGKALRFHEWHVRPMGRTAAGVMAIRLLNDDVVIGLEVVKEGSSLLVLHEGGWGKRVRLDEYSPKGRYTQGLWTTDHRRLAEIGPIVSARVVNESDQVTVITSKGIVLRTSVAGISQMGRSTRVCVWSIWARVIRLQPSPCSRPRIWTVAWTVRMSIRAVWRRALSSRHQRRVWRLLRSRPLLRTQQHRLLRLMQCLSRIVQTRLIVTSSRPRKTTRMEMTRIEMTRIEMTPASIWVEAMGKDVENP